MYKPVQIRSSKYYILASTLIVTKRPRKFLHSGTYRKAQKVEEIIIKKADRGKKAITNP